MPQNPQKKLLAYLIDGEWHTGQEIHTVTKIDHRALEAILDEWVREELAQRGEEWGPRKMKVARYRLA